MNIKYFRLTQRRGPETIRFENCFPSNISHLFISILISLCLISQVCSAQDEEKKTDCPPPENKKALDLFKKGTDKKKYQKPERLKYLKEALELEPAYAQAAMAMGNEIIVKCKLDNLPYNLALPYYKIAVATCPKIHSQPYYYIGYSYYEDAKNDSAIKYLNLFLKFTDDDEKKFSKDYQFEQYQSKEMVRSIKKEAELKKKTVPFDPKVLLPISTANNEYLPYLSPDETIFLFTRTMPDQGKDKVYQTDKEKEVFIIATKQPDGKFDIGKPMDYPFNVNSNEGGACLSIDNKHLFYTIYKMEGGLQPNADIYYSDNIEGGWQAIKKVPNINHPIYWDSQPSISADGNTLYFVSDRPGGVGKLDIWKSERNPETRQWQAPVNLGPKINTTGNEKCPFIHSDSETLYYSSDGLFGFGGLDIYYVHKDDKGNWKEPENIGTPINGEGDDAGFFVSTDGINGYFCSNGEGKVRGKGVGKYDVYYFELYKEARPEAVTFIRGEVKQESGSPVAAAVVELKNTKTKEITKAVYDSTDGSYVAAVNLKKNKDALIVTVKAPDYSFASQAIELKEASFEKPTPPATLNVEVAEKGKVFVIDNIEYATGAADLYPRSFVTLDEFAEYLKLNPSMKVEIQGHTDNIGSDIDNKALSQRRADNVMKYLIEKNIAANRLTAKGYGASQPIADNGTVAGKAKNRRTAFLILDK